MACNHRNKRDGEWQSHAPDSGDETKLQKVWSSLRIALISEWKSDQDQEVNSNEESNDQKQDAGRRSEDECRAQDIVFLNGSPDEHDDVNKEENRKNDDYISSLREDRSVLDSSCEDVDHNDEKPMRSKSKNFSEEFWSGCSNSISVVDVVVNKAEHHTKEREDDNGGENLDGHV